jgi:hypothetical protein
MATRTPETKRWIAIPVGVVVDRGAPYWKWPRVKVARATDCRAAVRLMVGWRYTALTFWTLLVPQRVAPDGTFAHVFPQP